VIHKTSHTAYYPGAEKVSLMLVFDRTSGKILGAQAAGRVGVEKRIDVLATAIAGGLTVSDLAELDLAYAPPFNSPNGPVNMAAFTAENHLSGFSPSILASEVEKFILDRLPVIIDVRDPISYGKAHMHGSNNMSHNMLRDAIGRIPEGEAVLLLSDDGQKGHVALRMLIGAGIKEVYNLSGGYISLERHARAIGYTKLKVGLLPVEQKSIVDLGAGKEAESSSADGATAQAADSRTGPLIVDVRTPMEFETGAYPGAININLDELASRTAELGSLDREIVLYCASGARSAYGQRILTQMGFTNVRNAGGLQDIMAAGV